MGAITIRFGSRSTPTVVGARRSRGIVVIRRSRAGVKSLLPPANVQLMSYRRTRGARRATAHVVDNARRGNGVPTNAVSLSCPTSISHWRGHEVGLHGAQ